MKTCEDVLERAKLHFEDILEVLSKEIPEVEYAKVLAEEAVRFCDSK